MSNPTGEVLNINAQITEYDFRRERGEDLGVINGAVFVRLKLTDKAREIIDNRRNWWLAPLPSGMVDDVDDDSDRDDNDN